MERAEARHFIETWVGDKLDGYQAPERAGTPKGEAVGFSLSKMRAAYLMVGFDQAFTIKDIAGRVGTSPGVLKVWRTQQPFKEKMAEGRRIMAEDLLGTIRVEEEKLLEGEEPKWLMAAKVGSALPWLDFEVAEIIHQELGRRMESEEPSVRIFYQASWTALHRAAMVYNEETRATWARDMLPWTKAMIMEGIDLLASPESWTEKNRPHSEQLAESLKGMIGRTLDSLS